MAPQMVPRAIKVLLLKQDLAETQFKEQLHSLSERIELFNREGIFFSLPPSIIATPPFPPSTIATLPFAPRIEVFVQKTIDASNCLLNANTELCEALALCHAKGTLDPQIYNQGSGSFLFKSSWYVLRQAKKTIQWEDECMKYIRQEYEVSKAISPLLQPWLYSTPSSSSPTTDASPLAATTLDTSTSAAATLAASTSDDPNLAATTLDAYTSATVTLAVFTSDDPTLATATLAASTSDYPTLAATPSDATTLDVSTSYYPTSATTSVLPFSQEDIMPENTFSFPLRSSKFIKTIHQSQRKTFYSKIKSYLQILLHIRNIAPG